MPVKVIAGERVGQRGRRRRGDPLGRRPRSRVINMSFT